MKHSEDYQAYVRQQDTYAPETPLLTPAAFGQWCERWAREYAAAWDQEPPDWATIECLERMLCA